MAKLNTYTLTFTYRKRLTAWDMKNEAAGDFLALALDEMREARAKVTSFSMIRLDDEGNLIVTPICESEVFLSIADQEASLEPGKGQS